MPSEIPADANEGVRHGGLQETFQVVWPLALAMMAGAANHICDRLFLSHVSDAALEAVLPAESISQTLTLFLAAIIGYSSTFVAQFHGGGKGHSAVRAFAQGLWLTAFSLPLYALAIPVGLSVIHIAGHAEAVMACEKTYFTIAAPGGAIQLVNCVLAGILTGQGRTRYAGTCTILGSLSNLALDPLFIFVCGLGIAGAAFATIIAQAITGILLLHAILHDPLVAGGFAAGDFRLQRKLCAAILRFGLPLGLSALVGNVSFTVFNLVVGRCSPLEVAASNTIFAINNIFFLAACATSQGITILTGRYHGAHRDDIVSRVARSGLTIVAISLIICFSIAIPGSGFIMDLFRDADSTFDALAFRRCGFLLFTIMFFREIAEGAVVVLGGALRGVGDTKYVMLTQSAIEALVRLPLVFIVAAFSNSIYLLWLTMPLDLGLTALLFAYRWSGHKWQSIRLAAGV